MDKTNVQWVLENRIQSIEMKESGWNFQRINTMEKSFHESGELNSCSYVYILLKSSALVNIKTDDKYCLSWSILACLHPHENGNPNRVSNYKQDFNELIIQDFDFSNGFKCSDKHRFEKLNNLSKDIFELNFHQEQSKRKHKLIPIEISTNESDRVRDLLFVIKSLCYH